MQPSTQRSKINEMNLMPPLPPPPPNESLQAMAVAAATVPPVAQADMPDVTQIIMPPFPVRDGNPSYAVPVHPSLPPWQQPQQPRPQPAAAASQREVATSTTTLAAARTTTPLDEAMAAVPPRGIPFDPSDYPELQIDCTATQNYHSNLVRAFREPLFPKDPSPVLAIAYSHRTASALERDHIKQQKKQIVQELQAIRSEFAAKKQQQLAMNSRLKASSQKVGAWTRKVFDLELKEPGCAWNEKFASLQEYVATHDKIPEHCHKLKGSGTEKQLAAFVANQRSKVKRRHKSCTKYPHRYQALEALGVHWESENDARFDAMFAKLLAFKKEHGTLRMPSLDLCKESGDEELIALHNWVFSQVGAFRYQLKTKKVEMVKRFLDIGFSFEKWYGTNGHVFDREIPPFDAICRRYVMNGGKIDEDDLKILNAAAEKSLKRGGGRKRKTKNNDEMQVSGTAEEDGVHAATTTGVADTDDRAYTAGTRNETMHVAMTVDSKPVESGAQKPGFEQDET
jgi:hypothetical protein